MVLKESAEYIISKLKEKPLVCIIAGSGLGTLSSGIESQVVIDYSDIPNFPVSTVEGHAGKLICGKLGNKTVLLMQGRFHYYEGYNMQQVVFPIRVMKILGVKYLFVSNAAGSLNPEFKIGDLMIIKDHINFFPENPLRGKNIDKFGPRFPDMSQTYNRELIQMSKQVASEAKIELKEGIYIGSSGPTLETPAEYNLFRLWGADSTGMSTVPEVIVAHHAGIKCFGISVITNVSQTPETEEITTHEQVQINAASVGPMLGLIFGKW